MSRSTSANPALKPSELIYIIEACRPSLIITSAGKDGLGVIEEALQGLSDPNLRASLNSQKIFTVDPTAGDYGTNESGVSPKETGSSHGGARDWKWLLGKESYVIEPYQGDESERRAAIIIWSSGTSGKSKGVVLSHRAMVSNLQMTWYSKVSPSLPLQLNVHQADEGLYPSDTLVLGDKEVKFFHLLTRTTVH